jgi:hypothetical protein
MVVAEVRGQLPRQIAHHPSGNAAAGHLRRFFEVDRHAVAVAALSTIDRSFTRARCVRTLHHRHGRHATLASVSQRAKS